jgi:outer membrane receptor protein involved in Fe transport
LFGQAETGQITGSVVDPSGAIVANAVVTVTNIATGAVRDSSAGPDGLFTVPNLLPADYDVTVAAPGFQTYKTRATVAVGSKLGLDVKLTIGQTGTVVEVSESVVAVNTETQTLEQTLTTKDVLELPTLSRNPYSLVGTSGTVSEDDPSARGVGYAINGLRSASTNVMLDGVANNDEFNAAIGQQVPLDSVQEIGIVTNNFTAEMGRASAGIINVTTKSGTNDFHGTAYEFNRVSDLASNTFQNNALGVPESIYTFNQFGFSVGGPIVKNKLFFFNNTEWTRIRSAANEQAYVPDPALIAASSPSTQAVFADYGKLAAGVSVLGTYSRNQLAAAGSDPCAGASAGGGCASYNPNAPMFDLVNYTVAANAGAGTPQNTYDTVSRIDYNLSDKTQIYGRYALYSELDQMGSVSSSPYDGFNTGQTNFNNAFIVSMTHVFSTNFISQTKLDFNRLNNIEPIASAGVTPRYFLGSQNTATQIGTYGVALPGYLPFGPDDDIPFGGPQNLGQFYQDLTYTMGKHSFRFGGSATYIRDNRTFGAYEEASNILGTSVGQGLDNLIAGQDAQFAAAIYPQGKFPCVGGVETPACTVTLPVGPPSFARSNRYREGAAYLQDTWKISRRVTLNLGVRWEYYGVQHNVNSAVDSNFYYPYNVQPQNPQFIQDVIQGYAATVPNSPIKELWKPSWGNFAPRLGIAWDVFGDGKTSFRAGYGIGYERNFGNVTYNVLFNPPNYSVIDLVAGSNVSTIPLSTSNAGPLAGTSGTAALPPSELRAVDPYIPQAYAHLLSASIERNLFQTHHLEIDYSGSIGENQYDISPVNFPGTGNYYGGIPCNPADTFAPGATDGCTAPLNSQYSAINFRGAGGHSTYNALNVRYDIANMAGFTTRVNYTYSHSIDDLSDTFSASANQFNLGYTDFQDPSVDKGSSNFDNRHRVALLAIRDIPFARHLPRAARLLLDGWEFAPVFTARTGAPFTIYDLTNDNYIYTRVVLAQGMPAVTRTATATPDSYNLWNFSQININEWINPKTGDSDFGPFPANMTGRNAFRAPGTFDLDLGMYKSVKFTERMSLQLRLEAFNAINHANFAVNTGSAYIFQGAGTVGSGTITGGYGLNGVAGDNRNVQLGAKLIF